MLSNDLKHYASYLIPFAEMVSWLGYLIWCVQFMFDSEAYMLLIVFGIVALLLLVPSWYLIRDFLFGMLLIVQRKIELNRQVEIDKIAGVIVKIDHLSMDVKSKNGNIDTIPYSKIRSKIISKSGENTNLEKQLISFTFSLQQDINKTVEQLQVALLNSPWVAASQKPIVNNISRENDGFVVEVFVYLLKKEYTEKIKDYIKHYQMEEVV